MAKLVECVECGVQVSSDAKSCPKCQLSLPAHPRRCSICHQLEKPSKLSLDGLHPECSRRIAQLPDVASLICPLCKASIANPSTDLSKDYSPTVTCSSCGHPIRTNLCGCGRYVSIEGKPMALEFDWRKIYVHPSCYEREVAYRRKEGICERCGGSLDRTFFQTLIGSTKCRVCSMNG